MFLLFLLATENINMQTNEWGHAPLRKIQILDEVPERDWTCLTEHRSEWSGVYQRGEKLLYVNSSLVPHFKNISSPASLHQLSKEGCKNATKMPLTLKNWESEKEDSKVKRWRIDFKWTFRHGRGDALCSHKTMIFFVLLHDSRQGRRIFE